MSNASASNGACAYSGVGEKMVADTVEEMWTTFCISAVDNSPLGMNINTLCLKDGRFLEPDAGVIAMVEQLPLTLTVTVGTGDDAPDACDMVDESASVAMRNAGGEAGDRNSTCDVERRCEHQAIRQNLIGQTRRRCSHNTPIHTQCTQQLHIPLQKTTMHIPVDCRFHT
jgi:hypothetical protein